MKKILSLAECDQDQLKLNNEQIPETGERRTETRMNRKIEKFEDIEAWKEGMNLTVELYKLLSGCRDFGFRDQLQRAAVSITSNIALPYGIKEIIRI